jgi:hypothetical protein
VQSDQTNLRLLTESSESPHISNKILRQFSESLGTPQGLLTESLQSPQSPYKVPEELEGKSSGNP